MKSLRMSLVLGGLLTVCSVTLWLIAGHAMALASPGEELAFGWRLALYLWNWYVRLAPFGVLALFVTVLVLVGTLGGADLAEERKGLAAWLVLGLSTSAVSAVAAGAWEAFQLGGGALNPLSLEALHWMLSLLPLILVGILAGPAAGVAAVRVQRRVQTPKAGLRAWHVGVLVPVLSGIGPAVLILGLWVWWRSMPLGENGPAAEQGDEADEG
jgi:hypothetical protein